MYCLISMFSNEINPVFIYQNIQDYICQILAYKPTETEHCIKSEVS